MLADMCYMFYIAANRTLPLVHQLDLYPDLTVSEAREDVARMVRSCIHARHIYYVASWQGCGCGFCYEDRDELEATLAQIPDETVRATDRSDWQAGYNSVASLGRYLVNNLAHGPFHLYVAWAGYEGRPIKTEATIVPAYFGGHSFRAPDVDTLFTVVFGGPTNA